LHIKLSFPHDQYNHLPSVTLLPSANETQFKKKNIKGIQLTQ